MKIIKNYLFCFFILITYIKMDIIIDFLNKKNLLIPISIIMIFYSIYLICTFLFGSGFIKSLIKQKYTINEYEDYVEFYPKIYMDLDIMIKIVENFTNTKINKIEVYKIGKNKKINTKVEDFLLSMKDMNDVLKYKFIFYK